MHTALQGDPQVTTYSTGDEPNRKVVISLKGKYKSDKGAMPFICLKLFFGCYLPVNQPCVSIN